MNCCACAAGEDTSATTTTAAPTTREIMTSRSPCGLSVDLAGKWTDESARSTRPSDQIGCPGDNVQAGKWSRARRLNATFSLWRRLPEPDHPLALRRVSAALDETSRHATEGDFGA